MKPLALVRPMTLADLDDVLRIEQEVFEDSWSRKSFEFEIHGNRFSLPVVLCYQRAIIGHAVAWNLYHEFHIATIAIERSRQGQGWGEFLLKTLLGMADLADYALLEVRRSNQAAISLYHKYGFEEISVRRKYYKNGEDALVMKKKFPGRVRSAAEN